MNRPLVSLRSVMEQLNVSRKTVARQIAKGKLRACKVGWQWRFDPADVEDYIEAQKREATPKAPRTPKPSRSGRRSLPDGEVSWEKEPRYYQ